MSVAVDEITTREPSGKIGKTPEERYIALAARASVTTANVVLTMGTSKGWRYRLKSGDEVMLWAPPCGDRAITYTLKNAALWRAIAKRGEGLT